MNGILEMATEMLGSMLGAQHQGQDYTEDRENQTTEEKPSKIEKGEATHEMESFMEEVMGMLGPSLFDQNGLKKEAKKTLKENAKKSLEEQENKITLKQQEQQSNQESLTNGTDLFSNLLEQTKAILSNSDVEKAKKGKEEEAFENISKRVGEGLDLGDEQMNRMFREMFEPLSKKVFSELKPHLKEIKEKKTEKRESEKGEDGFSVPVQKPNTDLYQNKPYNQNIVQRLDNLLQFASKIKVSSLAQRVALPEQELLEILEAHPDLFGRFSVKGEYLTTH